LQESVKQIKENKEKMSNNRVYTCTDREPGAPEDDDVLEFLPTVAGTLSPSNLKFQFGEGRCFEEINFSYDLVYNGTDISEVTVWIETLKPKSLFCKD
jgi:hypothetical protein